MKNKIYTFILIIFILALLFPNIGLRDFEKNANDILTENRNITPEPLESMDKKEFYINFEQFYQDRLKHRHSAAIHWKKGLLDNLDVFSNDKLFYSVDSEILFSKDKCIDSFKAPKEKIEKINIIKKYVENQNVKFYLLIPPSKESIYRDDFPKGIKNKLKDGREYHYELDKLAEKYNIDNIFLYDDMMDEKENTNNMLWFVDDHHWSYYGASFAVNKVLKRISEDVPEFKFISIQLDVEYPDVFKECSYWGSEGFNVNYKTNAPWSSKFTDKIFWTDSVDGHQSQFIGPFSSDKLGFRLVKGENILENRELQNGKTILILGDSYSSYMAPYLIQYSSKLITTHYYPYLDKDRMVELKRLMDTYKPNVVILEMVSWSFFMSEGTQMLDKIIME